MRQGPYTSTGRSATMTSTPATGSTAASSSPCGCGCHDRRAGASSCCGLLCFERPSYFCGQLLSDSDLTVQQTYLREKNKLYHRTMDGSGVVCGLRMYRDPRCKGHVKVGEGYAIDPCGNDLVVCEEKSFDVIGELRRKKWLVETPGDRPRLDVNAERNIAQGEGESGCLTKQCFYIGICYSEEPVDFATPYTTECSAAPGPCQPSRIREGTRFEIYDTMPVRSNPLDSIGKRIEQSFRMFREGQFSKNLASNTDRILAVLRCGEETNPEANQPRQDARGLFKELQAQFLHELRTSPDQYNWDLENEVYRLLAPEPQERETDSIPLEPFTKLFELIQKYVFSSVLAQLAFSCPEPPDSFCVLLGSVEVTNGYLTRVINYPRWYLWCFANFFDVFLYTIAHEAAFTEKATTNGAPAEQGSQNRAKGGCAPAFEIDVCHFLNLFSADHQAFEKAARASVDAIQASYRALVAGFDFTRPSGIAPSVLRNLDRATAERLTGMLGLQFEPSTRQSRGRRDVFAALADNTLHFRSETLVYETEASGDASGDTVTQVSGVLGAPAFAVGAYPHSMLTDILKRLTIAEERLRIFEGRLGSRRPEPPPPAENTPPKPPPSPPRGDVK